MQLKLVKSINEAELKRKREKHMLYIMRHGKTDWNVKKKLQGRSDIPLNEEGRKMAAEAAELYKEIPFDICYVSPLLRARQTAELVLEGRSVPVRTDDRLMEMCFGICEGTEKVLEHPDCPVYPFFTDPANYTEPPEGAESFAQLFARTGSFLKEQVYPRLEKGENVLIIGHGAMNCSIVCQYLDLSIEHFWDIGIPNCKLINLDERKALL